MIPRHHSKNDCYYKRISRIGIDGVIVYDNLPPASIKPDSIKLLSMNSLFFPSLPLIVLLTSLLLKRGAIVSSVIGSLAVLSIIFYDDRYSLNLDSIISTDLPIVLILTFSVALVIIPGQIFNSLLQQSGTIKEIGARIEKIKLSRTKMASIIVLGLAPMLESMTGFGVSLFFTVPVLVQLFSLRKALLLALLGMNIMPWGTLALATLVGAQISGVSFQELSVMTSLTSFAVFPTIGFLIFIICRKHGSKLYSGLLYPLLSGVILSCSLVFYNTWATAELVGVYAGLTTTMVALLVELLRSGKNLLSGFIRAQPSLLNLFAPYLVLIFLIGLSRIPVVYETLQGFFSIESGKVKLFVFTSPGISLFLTVIFIYTFSKKHRGHSQIFYTGIKRSIYPVTGIMLFVVFAQIHRASGIFEQLISQIINLQLAEITFIAPLLGMISGYTTGSNVGGNALFMSLQSETGSYFGRELVFAALQNSSAGHAVFMSLPIILLALSIAAAANKRNNSGNVYSHQAWLIRRTLLCAPLIYAALVIPFYLLTN